MNRHDFAKLIAGGCLTILFTAMVFGPMGFGRRYADELQHRVRSTLNERHLDRIDVVVDPDPIIRRTVVLSGPIAKRDRIVAIEASRKVPGVANVRWAEAGSASNITQHAFSVRH